MTTPDEARQLTAVVDAEPLCCGEPMVHNSATGEWECADAFFALTDEPRAGLDQWTNPADLTERDVPRGLRPALRHWRQSRTPDGWDHA